MEFKITNLLISLVIFICLLYISNINFRNSLNYYTDNILNPPCKNPIEYSIGSFDSRFGISQDLFLKALKEAEGLWEEPSNRDLFNYSSEGKLKINLVYDYRQDSTNKLSDMDQVIDEGNEQYDQLKKEYQTALNNYNTKLSEFNNLVSIYESKVNAYEAAVKVWNKNPRIEGKREELLAEKEAIDSMANQISVKEVEVNTLVSKVNQLASELNNMAVKLNLDVNKYNTISGSFEGEFEQGNYTTDARIREINIYQFDDYEKLVSVLTHELGHAVGLDHIDNPKDIMYSINTNEVQTVTNDSLKDLENICNKESYLVK